MNEKKVQILTGEAMQKKKRLRMDALLIALLLLATGVLYLVFGRAKDDGVYVVVNVEGEEVARYPLNRDGVYSLNYGSNILQIEDGYAWIREADCPDQICVLLGKINRSGELIVCLPNMLIVYIEGGEEPLDGTVG